jgi:hypothetical protein
MWHRWLRSAVVSLLALVVLVPQPAAATQKFGPLQLSGNLQSENLVRHPNASRFEYIMNRNTARLRLDYDWLQMGKFYNKWDIPFIESSHLYLLWRGVYDSVYDTTPGFVQKEDIKGRAYPAPGGGSLGYYDYATRVGAPRCGKGQTGSNCGSPATTPISGRQLGLSGLSGEDLDALKLDNQLREFYADVKFRTIPLTMRIGRQQVVWGETDNFRMLDRANPLDLTWHFQQEIPAPPFGWDEIRRPLWMVKFLYDLGDVWKFSQSFLEWYWNPGDWYPAKQTYLPRPWGLPFYNPLTNPVDGAFYDGPCFSSGGLVAHSHVVQGGLRNGQFGCVRLIGDLNKDLHLGPNAPEVRASDGTRLFEQGNYSRWDPLDNSQVGVRYHGIAPMGLEFTLNYFYQRWSGDDGTNYAPLKGINRTFRKDKNGADIDVLRLTQLTSHGIFPAQAYMPYVHTIGASANYSDETFTQTVFRAETVYDVGIPFFDTAKPTIIDTPSLPGVTRKNMWKGMIAFDRPTWIRTVNKKSTVFLTGQFFFHYLVNDPPCRAPDGTQLSPADVAALSPPDRVKYKSCLVGGLDLPSSVRQPGRSPVFRDKIRQWETLATFAAFTFYRGGSIVPIIGIAVDTTNQFNMEPFWTVDYVVSDSFVVNVAQRYFVEPRGRSEPVFETWGVAGLNAGRSETSLRMTFQF